MKKLGRILVLTIVLAICFTSFAFASNLTLSEIYPKEGASSVALENFAVKLTFESEFSSDVLGTSNDKMFTLTGPFVVNKEIVENYSFPLKVLYSEKNPNEILVLIDKNENGSTIALLSNEDYVFSVSSDLKDNAGNTLGAVKTLNFKTLNQTRNNTVNTVLMFVMMGAIVVFTMRSSKKQAEKEEVATPKKEEAFNPYKEAKRTGKSLEQVIAEHEKEVAKKEAKEARKKKEEVVDDDDDILYLDAGHYYVTSKRAIDPEKSKYVKALKEKKAKEREEEAIKKAKYEQAKKKSKKK